MTRWESETLHRQELERIQYTSIQREIQAVATDRRIGLFLGWITGAAGLASVVFLALKGADIIGLTAVVTAIGGLVWAVRRSTREPQERETDRTHE